MFEPVIALAAEALESDRRMVTHALARLIASNAIPSQPSWFAEGVAGYFETVRVDGPHAAIDVGVPIEDRLHELKEGGTMPSAQLFACDRSECLDARYYSTAWALIAYLVNEHRTQLGEYIDRLVQTPAGNQAQLWPGVPHLPPEKLDHELAKWLHYGSINVLEVRRRVARLVGGRCAGLKPMSGGERFVALLVGAANTFPGSCAVL